MITKKIVALVVGLVAIVSLTSACLPQAPTTDGKTAGVLTAMNRDRNINGVPSLAWNNQLAGNARSYAGTLAAYNAGLVHQDLGALLYRSDYAGYNTLGENLLVGPGGMTPTSMEAAWMASAAHRANILRGSFTSAGVGYAYGPDGRIWVVVEFGG